MFTGREWRTVFGFYEYRARAYSPTLGRFMSEDPKGFDAGDYNLFRYCDNDPVDNSDPTGLLPIPFFLLDQTATFNLTRLLAWHTGSLIPEPINFNVSIQGSANSAASVSKGQNNGSAPARVERKYVEGMSAGPQTVHDRSTGKDTYWNHIAGSSGSNLNI